MKILNKRIQKGTIVLFFILTILTVSSLLITTNYNGKNDLAKMSRGFYSANIIRLYTTEIEEESLISQLLNNINEDNGIIFKINLESNYDLRGVFYKGNVDIPPMKSGRFFTYEECLSNQKLALIGGDYETDVIKKSDKSYITIGEEEFEVIGILGSTVSSRIDNMQMIPMQTALEIYGSDGQYVVDGSSEESVANIAVYLLSMIEPHAGAVSVSEQNTGRITKIEDMLNGSTCTMNIIYSGIYLSFLLAAISCIGFWISYRRQSIQVYRMNGFTNLQIVWLVIKKYCFVWFGATSTGIVGVLLLRVLGSTYPLYWNDFAIVAGFTLIPGILLLLGYLISILSNITIECPRKPFITN